MKTLSRLAIAGMAVALTHSAVAADDAETLFGGTAPRSEVEKNTISRAGVSAPGIRSNVGDPGTYTVAKGEITREILATPQGDGREAQASIAGS